MPRYDANGEPIEEATRPRTPPRPRQLRSPEVRARDANPGVRDQAISQLRSRRRYDANGELIDPNAIEAQTAPNARSSTRRPTGNIIIDNPIINAARDVGDWVAGNVDREQGAGEIAWQSIPEQQDVQWHGGVLSPALNALPREARTWLDAEGRAARVGLGNFLDFNPAHREQIIRANVPTAEFRDDRFGNRMVRFSPDQEWAYINRPGLSPEDALTAAGETEKYLLARRFLPGGRLPAAGTTAGATTPLLSSTLREGAAGGLSTTLGQTAAMSVGGPGPDLADVAGSAAGAALGNVIGHGVASTVRVGRSIPEGARRAVDWLSDRMPGGAQRAAERTAAAQELLAGLEDAARRQAADAARRSGLQGEALQRAIRNAEEDAVARVRAQVHGADRDIDTLARTFGVRLARAQTEGDIGGMQFIYEAAGGVYGDDAARAAQAFLANQNAALPQAIRGIAENPLGINSPQAGVSVARQGVEQAYRTANAAETQAWDRFGQHAGQHLRTFEQTPGGRNSGVTQVIREFDSLLRGRNIYMTPLVEGSEPGARLAAGARTDYPRVARVLDYARDLQEATRRDAPFPDVQRVVQIRRRIDEMWEAAQDSPAERRVLTAMRERVTDWLRNPNNLARRAPQTSQFLQEADRLTTETSRVFRDNRIMQEIIEPRGAAPMTDEQVAASLFGGGRQGLRVNGEGVEALRAMREALGPASPEWASIRQAALQRLTRGLEDALPGPDGRPALNQTPAIITTYRNIEEAFRTSREAMEVLFSPAELSRLREAQRVVSAMAPTPRNPANPTNSGITAARAMRGLLEMIATASRGIPGPNIVANAARNATGSARMAIEEAGAPSDGYRVARALASLWDVNRSVSAVSGSAGASTAANSEGGGGRPSVVAPASAVMALATPSSAAQPDDAEQPASIRRTADGRFQTADGRVFSGYREAEAYANYLNARSIGAR